MKCQICGASKSPTGECRGCDRIRRLEGLTIEHEEIDFEKIVSDEFIFIRVEDGVTGFRDRAVIQKREWTAVKEAEIRHYLIEACLYHRRRNGVFVRSPGHGEYFF